MDKTERLKMVSAMEFIARHVNDEDVFDFWLLTGVADGDVAYGQMCDDEVYIEDDEAFSDLMDTFLMLMQDAEKSGGLYCDGVCSDIPD